MSVSAYRSTDEKFEEFREQCYEQNSMEGCHSLAQYYQLIEKNFTEAARLFSLNCGAPDHRYALSCFTLGTMHLQGTHPDKEEGPSASVPLFEKACALRFPEACFNLGVMMSRGSHGLERDPKRALRFFDAGCSANGDKCCFSAGALLLRGGKDEDKKEAMGFFEKACFAGNPLGCANVAVMLGKGDGVERDQERAAQFQDMARELGKAFS